MVLPSRVTEDIFEGAAITLGKWLNEPYLDLIEECARIHKAGQSEDDEESDGTTE